MKKAFLLLFACLPFIAFAQEKYSYAEGRSGKIDSTGRVISDSITTVWQWYGTDGKLEKQVELSGDSLEYRNISWYNDRNEPERTIVVTHDVDTMEMTFKRNNKGDLTEYTVRYGDELSTYLFDNKYGKNGRIVHIKARLKEAPRGFIEMRTEHEYRDTFLTRAINIVNKDTNFVYNYTLRPDGGVTMEQLFYSYGEPGNRNVIEYDKQKRFLTETYYDASNVKHRSVFQYSDDRLHQRETTYANGSRLVTVYSCR